MKIWRYCEGLRDLDQGEAESIALAIEIGADLIVMDEREGRRAAQRLGVSVIGVVGILIQAKRVGVVAQLRPHLDALRHIAGFYLDAGVYQHALQLTDERDR